MVHRSLPHPASLCKTQFSAPGSVLVDETPKTCLSLLVTGVGSEREGFGGFAHHWSGAQSPGTHKHLLGEWNLQGRCR